MKETWQPGDNFEHDAGQVEGSEADLSSDESYCRVLSRLDAETKAKVMKIMLDLDFRALGQLIHATDITDAIKRLGLEGRFTQDEIRRMKALHKITKDSKRTST